MPTVEEAWDQKFLVIVETPWGRVPQIGALIYLENLDEEPDQFYDPALYPRWYVEDGERGTGQAHITHWMPILPLP